MQLTFFCRRRGHWRILIFLQAFALIPICSSSSANLGCNASGPDCSTVCKVVDSCLCSVEYSRCRCRDQASALLKDGRCISTSSGRRAQIQSVEQRLCPQDALNVSVLLVAAATPSPELGVGDVLGGRLSPSMSSVLHWSAASAMGFPVEKVSLHAAKIISNVAQGTSSQPVDNHSMMFFDVSFYVCAAISSKLVSAGTFEARFVQSWQSFAAFSVTTVRLLELQELYAPGAIDKRPPHLPSDTASAAQNVEKPRNPIWEDFFWLWPVAGIASALLLLVIGRLIYKQCSKHARDSPRHWRDVAPAVHLDRGPHNVQSVPNGPGGGALVSVMHSFDPHGEDGAAFAGAAGLEASECLTLSKDDLLEIFARGEGWLYGRLFGNELFGYLPEPCVCWIDSDRGGNDGSLVDHSEGQTRQLQ